MDQLLLAVLVFAVHLWAFCLVGYTLMRIGRVSGAQTGDILLSGYFGYFLLFELLCVPAQLSGMRTSRLGYVITAVLVFLQAGIVIDLMFRRRRTAYAALQRQIKCLSFGQIWQDHGPMLIILLGVVLYQIAAVVLSTSNSADAAYYIAESSVSAFTDRLGRYDVDNTSRLSRFNIRYIYSAYPMHNAVAARLSGLAAIIQAKSVMPAINVTAANLIYYRIGLALFKGKEKQNADIFVCFIFMINQLAGTLFQPGTFFYTRAYEGKSMVVNVVLPMILCGCLRLWNDASDRQAWIWIFLAGGAGMCFAGSGILAMPLTAACLLPTAIHHRRIRIVLFGMVSVLPIIVWGIVYTATSLGYISLKIRW